MARWKKITIRIATIVLFFVGGIVLFVRSLPDLCRNEIIAESPSFNRKLKSVTFQRDCGATTGFSTQVSILPIDSVLENEGGNTFSADTNHGAAPFGQGGGPEVRLRWLSDTRLQIQHHQLVRIFRAESKSKEVQVEFVTFQ